MSDESVLHLLIQAKQDADERLLHRLDGIEDDEWFWEPVPDRWSVRRREQCTSEWANGSGAWVVDYGPETNPAHFTTISWRVLHIALTSAGYLDMIAGWDWGSGRVPWNQYAIPSRSATGIDLYISQSRRLSTFASSLTDASLSTPAAIPFLGTNATIGDALRVLANEAAHHGAEVGVMRDLYLRTRHKPQVGLGSSFLVSVPTRHQVGSASSLGRYKGSPYSCVCPRT